MWNEAEQQMMNEARAAMDDAAKWRARRNEAAAARCERRAEAMTACAWASMNNRMAA